MAKKTPEWLNTGDGFADVTLSRAFELHGVKVSSIRMREPTVADQLASEKEDGDALQEIALFANLVECTPDDIKRLPLRDMRRLQEAYLGFII